MKINYILLLFLVTLSCKNEEVKKASQKRHYPEFNITSANKFMELASKVGKNQNISDQEWQELFSSDGYRNYLIYSDSLSKNALRKRSISFLMSLTNRSSTVCCEKKWCLVLITSNYPWFKTITR